jgi:hypothetical protein
MSPYFVEGGGMGRRMIVPPEVAECKWPDGPKA